MAGIGILTEDSSGTEYAYKILTPEGATNNSILDLSTVAIINDDLTTTNNVYSAYKTQGLHDLQAQAIANLATASAQIVHSGTTSITTVDQQLPFIIDINSSNTNIITLDDTLDTITMKVNASYNFSSSVTMYNTSGGNLSRTIIFDLVDATTNAVIVTTSALISLRSHDYETYPIITLLTIGKDGFPNAPVSIKILVRADGTGIDITGFRSILASSNAYDFSMEASGVTFIPGSGLLSTDVQSAIEEVQDNLTLSGGFTSTFMDAFNKAKSNADSITNSYVDGSLVSQSIIENSLEVYTIGFAYTLGVLTSKTIIKTSGGSVVLTYNYDVNGALTGITQVGGD